MSEVATDEMRRPGRPRDAQADHAILEAALHELVASGYAGLSMDKVAARAGVSKATIYRRWPSREAMILDAWRAVAADKDHRADTGSLRTDLDQMCTTYPETFTNQLVSLLPQIVAAAHQSPQLNELFRAFVDEQMAPIEHMYQRAAERGELRAGIDPKVASQLLAGLIFFRLLLRSEMLPLDDLRAGIDIALNGMLADDARQLARPKRRKVS